jgi:ribosome recycling factor
MLDDLYLEAMESFDKCIVSLQRDLSRLRTGRASLALLDGVRVEYYGSPTPLSQVASVNISDPKLIVVKPWDKSLMTAVEKGILAADVGITPNSDGTVIRLPIPPLTVERRKDLVKQVKKMAEAARVAVRSVRRDVKGQIDALEIPEDDQHRAEKKLQDLTDDNIKRIDQIAEAKEAEIME